MLFSKRCVFPVYMEIETRGVFHSGTCFRLVPFLGNTNAVLVETDSRKGLRFPRKQGLNIVVVVTDWKHSILVYLQCVVGGCNVTFASQGGLARHVPTHFSSQNSSKVSSQGRLKEESPSKAGLNKRRKLKNKYRRSLRMFKNLFSCFSLSFPRLFTDPN